MACWLYTALGAAVGSFLNVCIDRLPRGRSLIRPSSHCETCGRTLTPWELVPILSYLLLRGRCRSCGARIPLRVLWVELGAAALFGLLCLRFGLGPWLLLASAYSSLLLVVVVIDLEHHKILNRLTYPAIALAAVAAPFTPGRPAVELFLGGLLGFGLLFLLAWAIPSGMGMGDVKLSAFLGLTLGYPHIVLALLLAFISGGLVAGSLWAARVLRRGDAVAFGPFLASSGFVTLLYGDAMLGWWLGRV